MKNSCTCDGCYWQGHCEYDSPCEYYSPMSDGDDDESIKMMIERERAKFYREWFRYIGDFE